MGWLKATMAQLRESVGFSSQNDNNLQNRPQNSSLAVPETRKVAPKFKRAAPFMPGSEDSSESVSFSTNSSSSYTSSGSSAVTSEGTKVSSEASSLSWEQLKQLRVEKLEKQICGKVALPKSKVLKELAMYDLYQHRVDNPLPVITEYTNKSDARLREAVIVDAQNNNDAIVIENSSDVSVFGESSFGNSSSAAAVAASVPAALGRAGNVPCGASAGRVSAPRAPAAKKKSKPKAKAKSGPKKRSAVEFSLTHSIMNYLARITYGTHTKCKFTFMPCIIHTITHAQLQTFNFQTYFWVFAILVLFGTRIYFWTHISFWQFSFQFVYFFHLNLNVLFNTYLFFYFIAIL